MNRPKLTYGLIILIGILLLLKGTTIAISQFETIKIAYGFKIDFSLLMILLHRGFFVEIVMIVISFIGLFIKKNIGYKLLLLFPTFSIGLFFLMNNDFINLEWTLLIVPILILFLANTRFVRQYFQIDSMKILWRSLSFSSAIGLLIALMFRLIMI